MSEGLEGLGRIMKVTALDDPEGPLSPRTEDDPTKSDEFNQDELARKSPGYLRAVVDKAVADATASYEAKLAEKDAELNRRKAAENMLVRRTGELQDQLNRAPGANPAPAIRRNPMKWQTFVIAALCVVTGGLVYKNNDMNARLNDLAAHGVDANKKVDDLATWYVEREFGDDRALAKETLLKLTPMMERLGAERFVATATKMAFADDATIERLLKRGVNQVVQCFKENGVVWLQGRCAVGSGPSRESMLIHVRPHAVYAYEKALSAYDKRIAEYELRTKSNYMTADEASRRMALQASLSPPVSRGNLETLCAFRILNAYDELSVFHLVSPYGTDERFIHADDEAYRFITQTLNYTDTIELRYANSNWWYYNVRNAAIKEEQTTAKVGE